MEVDCRNAGRPTHTRGTPEQMGARARAKNVSKQVLVVLATNFLNATHQDANRIRGLVDNDLREGLRAKTASHCLAPLKRAGIIKVCVSAGIMQV